MRAGNDAVTNMPICNDGYSETEWADYHLGMVRQALRSRMEEHKRDCVACGNAHMEWSRLLSDCGPLTDTEAGARERETTSYPSERHYKSIKRAIRRKGLELAVKRWGIGGGLATTAAAIMLALVLAGKPETAATPPNLSKLVQVDAYVMSEEPNALRVLQAADTSEYRIESHGNRAGSGHMWLSGDSSEAFLLVDDLPSIGLADYQAWAVIGGRQTSLGLIKLSGTRGHLHIRERMLGSAELLSLTAEPKGGSRLPTTEQIVLLLFHQP